MSKQTISQENNISEMQKRAQSYLKENEVLLKKHRLLLRLVINFAEKKKVPLLSRIALWIVNKQGGLLDIQFGEIQK